MPAQMSKNLFLMIIFDTPANYLSNVDQKSYMRKVRTPSVKSPSDFFC